MEEVVLLEETSIWKIAVKSTEKNHQTGIGVVNTICLAFFPNVFFTTTTVSGTTLAVEHHHQEASAPRIEQYVKKQQHQ